MRETSSNTREIVTCERLRQLKMSGMADAYEKQLNDPNADLTCFEERFAEIVEREWQIRYDKKFNRLLKLARRKGQILRSTPNTAPLICGAYNTQPEGLLTTA